MMVPAGGISLLVHMLINIFFSLMRYPRKALPFLIIFVVAVVVIASGSISVVNSLEENNNLQIVQEIVSPCRPVEQNYSENKVILRVDDIQANAYESMAKRIIKDARKYDMRLVLGIIPRNFLKDKRMARIVKMNSCNAEAAMHGWGHFADEEEALFEFEDMEEAEARTKIMDGQQILEEISGHPVITFIPPGNEISDETKKVLDEEGIKYISANEETGEFGMTTGTYNFPKKTLVDTDEMMEKCAEKFEIKDLCVIVIHPQDFMTSGKLDDEKYQFYLNLLSELRKANVYSVTFSDLGRPRELQREQSKDPAILFQTLPHPFQKDSTAQICSSRFF